MRVSTTGSRRVLAIVLAGALAAGAASQMRSGPALHAAATVDTAVDDARRAAAGRLLDASRFRERQGVLLDESIHAAQGDMVDECIERAATGQSLANCRATGGADLAARVATRRSDMLDEIMAASETIYARRFSAAEMDEITRFFRTPVGRKYGALYPQLIADVQARKAAIARRYLIRATRAKAGEMTP